MGVDAGDADLAELELGGHVVVLMRRGQRVISLTALELWSTVSSCHRGAGRPACLLAQLASGQVGRGIHQALVVPPVRGRWVRKASVGCVDQLHE